MAKKPKKGLPKKSGYVTLSIRQATFDRLAKKGRFKETWDKLLNRLYDTAFKRK